MTIRLLLLTSLLFISGGESGSSSTKRRSPQASSSSGGGSPVDFDCPEEFGYYAHPSDCTQYYVCVFGGALLESCTGGLMYSHELQTCDWPRNVGCAPGTTTSQQVHQVQPETRQRQSSHQQRERIVQQQIPKHDLYTEDEQLAAEELDSDRQQRVYRGQPQAIGQVQSDRDALSPHSNAIPVPSRDKLSVISYGTQQQYTSSNRLKPTGEVIQDKSDHNFLTNATRRVKRSSQLRSHHDSRPESFDSPPISWSSYQPRIIHHRRPQLIPSFPLPQSPPSHQSSHSPSHTVVLRQRPTYHRRPNEFKFEPSDAKSVKHVSSSTPQPPTLDHSPSPVNSNYKSHNQPTYSPSVDPNYHYVVPKQSTFRPSFGPPSYQPHPSNPDLYHTRPHEFTTKKPNIPYRSQVTKPPINYHSSTIKYPASRKPISYVYGSNNLHKGSGLQLSQGLNTNVEHDNVDDEKNSVESEESDEYEEEEDDAKPTEGTEQTLEEIEESGETPSSEENESASKNSYENYRPRAPQPPPSFYNGGSSTSASSEEKNPYASQEFDLKKFLDELKVHHSSEETGPSTGSQLYYEYASTSSEDSSPVKNYLYPSPNTTPRYYSPPRDTNQKHSAEGSSYNQGTDSPSSEENAFKTTYNPSQSPPRYSTYRAIPSNSSSNYFNNLKKAPSAAAPPDDTTSKYFYNTAKQSLSKHHHHNAQIETTPKYVGYYTSAEPYSQSPQYYQHPIRNTGSPPTYDSHRPPATTGHYSTDSGRFKNKEEYSSEKHDSGARNTSQIRPPKPPKAPKEPVRLQDVNNDAQEEEEYADDSEEYYDYEDDDDESEEENEDEEYDEQDEETADSGNTSSDTKNPKSEEDRSPTVAATAPTTNGNYMTSHTKNLQRAKPVESSTSNHLIKSTSVQGGSCITMRGKLRCSDSSQTSPTTSKGRYQQMMKYPNSNVFEQEELPNTTFRPSAASSSHQSQSKLRMRRPTSPLPSSVATLAPPQHKFTSSYGSNSSRQTPMLLSPSYPNTSTEPVAVVAKKPRQRQNRNKSELSEDIDMRDKGHTQRALTRMRASVTPAQQQYVEQQTTQQQQTTPSRAYNQSRYVPSQYDPPFYTLYDDEVDLYKEIGDYAQYNAQSNANQYRNQGAYKEKKPQIEIVQQEPARGSAFSKNKYNSQSDIYQSVTPQDYESYSIQTNDDLPYQQPQHTKTRSEVKESQGTDRSDVSTASPVLEMASVQTERTGRKTDSPVTSQIPEGPKPQETPVVVQIGRVNTPSPFKLPEKEPEQPVNLLTRERFIVREPDFVTRQVVDITPKPNNRNRAEVPQRTISIRVPQAAIDSNKYNNADESKQRPIPIRASDSAEWSGFRLGGEVNSNHQEEASRRPSLRVPNSIKVREEYLRGRERQGNEGPTRSQNILRRPQESRGGSRYQESVFELDEFAEEPQNSKPSENTPSLRGDDERTFIIEAERNARIQAQLRAISSSRASSSEKTSNADQRRQQEESRRKAYEEARVRQIEDAEKEAREQIRQRQYEESRARQVEEAEKVAKELEDRRNWEEAQRRANEDARRAQIAEAEKRAREEAERIARDEALKKAALEEKARIEAEEQKQRQIIEARRAQEEANRRAEIERAQKRAAIEEAQRKAAIEEAQRKAAVEEAQRKAAVEEARRRSALEEAQRQAALEEAQRQAALEEAERIAAEEESDRRAIAEEAKKKAMEEARIKHLENQRQLEEGLPRRRIPSRPSGFAAPFRPSSDNAERSKQIPRQNGFRIVVDTTTEPSVLSSRSSPSFDIRPPKKYVSRNSTLINELYLNEQSTSIPDSTPNSLTQTSPGRTYTENTRKTLDTPTPISKSDPEYSEKPVRVRPTTYDTQSTPGLTRGSSRHRGSQSYTVSPNEAEPAPQTNRGTPAAPRVRPTLKPSTTVVGKATEYADIFRHPPTRPDNIYPTPQPDKTAAKCRKDVCLLPDCSCGGKDIPGELTLEETPQIVLLTFDDSVNDLNKGLYEDLFEKGRVNPNGCPISGTFYVSHEWTDYSQVQNLYSNGHEIASHSVSHSFGEQFSQKKWTKEIAGQREILSAYGGVKLEDVRGMRAPFLAVGGNKMFKMLYDSNFTYDSSMPVYENKPPSWPYTMDYKIFHDCMIPPCPTKSYPGVWEVPMVMWQDLNGGRCSMGDACSNPPEAEGVYKMLIKNFERHFTTNRAPFGLFYHAAWFTQPHHKEGFIAFLDTINKMPEVWLVTNWQGIQWVRDPTPISRLNGFAPFGCDYPERPKKCNNPKVCNLWHKSGVRYMRTCQPCPDVYPWTGKSGVRNSRVDNEIINE